jgi:CHAT domain-containing protein
MRALPRGERFLVDDGYDFHLIHEARQLLSARRERDRGGHGLLAIGAPDFDVARSSGSSIWKLFERDPAPVAAAAFRGRSIPCASLAGQRWESLPGAAVEIREVERVSGAEETTVMTGRDATESNFRRLAPGRRIVHVATHGFFLEECSVLSRVPDNALLYSGLVLAGAHRSRDASASEESGDDGILTAEEVAALDLAGVEVAVLSACDTGRGMALAGEGVAGLRRAFEVAGAERLVMSAWRIPDRAAQRFMSSFYDHYLRGASVRETVATVTRERLEQERSSGRSVHPFLWAGMLSTGAWD